MNLRDRMLRWNLKQWLLFCLGLYLASCVIVICFFSVAFGQTAPRADQIRGIPAPSPESGWCPGEPLVRVDAQTLVIGEAWTTDKPCYAHFNITPPAGIDPISVSRFGTPARVKLTGVWTDDLYIYLQSPAFAGSTMTRPPRIVVQTRFPANVACTDCTIETAGTGLRMFPAFSMPVGLVRVEGGEIHPALDPIINSHQLYIGSDLGVAVRRDGAGMWIELSRAEAQVQEAQLAAASLAIRQARYASMEPVPVQRLNNLEEQFARLLDEISFLRSRVEELHTMATNAEEQRMRRFPDGEYEDGQDCEPAGALSAHRDGYLQVCESGKWERVRKQ